MRYWLSRFIPLPFRTEFVSHRGVPYRVWWWQWRGHIWAKGGRPEGSPRPEFVSPCSCHTPDGQRTALHPDAGGNHT